MLEYLHVKNLALIKEAELEFGEKLNILSGETGAGKSILLGSINLALGSRAERGLIRSGQEYALVELVFRIDSEELTKQLQELGVYPEDHRVILSRKIMEGKSQSRINGELVTGSLLKQVSSSLIAIHGQHEHQTLLNEENHLVVLDAYGKHVLKEAKEDYAQAYQAYEALKKQGTRFAIDPEARRRQIDFLSFEIQEISQAQLVVGEEDELRVEQRRLSYGKQIQEGLENIYHQLSENGSTAVGKSIRSVGEILSYDEELQDLSQQLYDLESLLQDATHSAKERLDHVEVDDQRLYEIEDRLNTINALEKKYGPDEATILQALQEKQTEFEQLENFEIEKTEFERKLKQAESLLQTCGQKLHQLRIQVAQEFSKRLKDSLLELNFLEAQFQVEVEETGHFRSTGGDHVQFFISANPGEPLQPLSKVASGGELSRIMLAIKSLVADTDLIPTLIFDEIDTGISGKTAAAVAEKMAAISQVHQVICISHLPQIVAMADSHFLIEKTAEAGNTSTQILLLDEEGSISELARLLGGSSVTKSSLDNAREMKSMAKAGK